MATGKSAVRWLASEDLWDVASEFIGWSYSLNDPKQPAGLPPPGYPLWLFDRGEKDKLGFFNHGNRPLYAPQRRYTNCSMFTEAVIIGAALC